MAAKEETGLVFSQRRKNIQKRGSSLGNKETKESIKNLGFSKNIFFVMENHYKEITIQSPNLVTENQWSQFATEIATKYLQCQICDRMNYLLCQLVLRLNPRPNMRVRKTLVTKVVDVSNNLGKIYLRPNQRPNMFIFQPPLLFQSLNFIVFFCHRISHRIFLLFSH